MLPACCMLSAACAGSSKCTRLPLKHPHTTQTPLAHRSHTTHALNCLPVSPLALAMDDSEPSSSSNSGNHKPKKGLRRGSFRLSWKRKRKHKLPPDLAGDDPAPSQDAGEGCAEADQYSHSHEQQPNHRADEAADSQHDPAHASNDNDGKKRSSTDEHKPTVASRMRRLFGGSFRRLVLQPALHTGHKQTRRKAERLQMTLMKGAKRCKAV